MNHLQQAYMMAGGGKWIQSAIKRPGAFTKKAKAAGMGVQGFANKVAANPEDYSTRTRRQANLAKTLKSIRKGEDGMSTYDPELDRQMMEESMADTNANPPTPPSPSELYAGLPSKDKAKTLYDAMSAIGYKGDYATRKKLFNDYFGGEYSGTAAQNTELLRKINSGEINLDKIAGGAGMAPAKSNYSYISRPEAPATAPANTPAAAPRNTMSTNTSSAVASREWNYTPQQWDQAVAQNQRAVDVPSYMYYQGPSQVNMNSGTPGFDFRAASAEAMRRAGGNPNAPVNPFRTPQGVRSYSDNNIKPVVNPIKKTTSAKKTVPMVKNQPVIKKGSPNPLYGSGKYLNLNNR